MCCYCMWQTINFFFLCIIDVFKEYFLKHHEDDLVAIFEAEEEEQHYPVYVK